MNEDFCGLKLSLTIGVYYLAGWGGGAQSTLMVAAFSFALFCLVMVRMPTLSFLLISMIQTRIFFWDGLLFFGLMGGRV